MKKLIALLALTTLVLGSQASSAFALTKFKKAFQEKYVKVLDNEKLTDAFKAAGCNTCHVKDEKKTVRNKYGEELAKLIDGDANQRIKDARKNGGAAAGNEEYDKVLKELDEAFDKVAKMAEEEGGATYGDRIKEGEFPVPPAK